MSAREELAAIIADQEDGLDIVAAALRGMLRRLPMNHVLYAEMSAVKTVMMGLLGETHRAKHLVGAVRDDVTVGSFDPEGGKMPPLLGDAAAAVPVVDFKMRQAGDYPRKGDAS